MLRGFVLRYLAAIAGGPDPAAARHEIPPPLRAAVERRARKHTIVAGFDSAHADDARHLARLAYLRVNKTPAHTDDLAAVELAFTNRRSLGKERRAGWVFASSTSLAAAVIGLAVGAGLYANRALPNSPSESSGSSEPEPSLEELLGMDQQTHHALRPVFRDLLPSYTVALDAHQRGREPAPPNDLAGARARVIERLRRDSPELVAPMVALLDAAERFSARRDELERTEGGQSDAELWTRRLVALHGALREQDVPFYVDATLRFDRRTGSQRVLMSTYDVRSRRRFATPVGEVRCLDIVRLDTLNYERSLLGYTRPEFHHALVRVDRIEEFIIERVLPSVHAALESVIVRGYEDERGTEWVTEFEEWAHDDLREESDRVIAAEAGGRAVGLAALAAAVVRRRNAVRAISFALRADGVRLRAPAHYRYRLERLERLGARIPAVHLAEVRAAQRELRTAAVLRAYEILADAFGLSIAKHEVQHRLDYVAGRLQQVPEVLSRYTGETESEDRVNLRAERANAELSAYLSQIARSPSLAHTSLLHVASFVMDRNGWRTPEAYAAVALFEVLADEHGVEHTPLVVRRRIQRAQVSRIYGVVRELSGVALSALASRAWTALYGEPLATIVQEE